MSLKCPACDCELTAMKFGGVTVDACHGGCGGIWFDAFELQRVDERHEVPDEHVLRVQVDPRVVVSAARRRPCPRCAGVKLKRHFFNAARAVEVDQCPHCGGYWLDHGELQKIRAEKQLQAALTQASSAGLSMETIRFLYRQKLEKSPDS